MSLTDVLQVEYDSENEIIITHGCFDALNKSLQTHIIKTLMSIAESKPEDFEDDEENIEE